MKILQEKWKSSRKKRKIGDLMLRDALLNIIEYTWPTITIVLVILLTYRIADIFLNKKSIILYQEVIHFGVVIYLLCLFYVVTFEDVSWSSNNFTLFGEITRYSLGSRLFFKNVISNALMFFPYGFFLSYFLKTRKWYIILISSFITSCAIEITQSAIGRVFDVDDILLNVIGALLGFLFYYGIEVLRDKIPAIFKKTWFLNMAALFIMGFLFLYLFNIFHIGELL